MSRMEKELGVSVENPAKYPIVFLCNVWWYLLDIYCMYVYCMYFFTQFHTLLMEVQVAIRQDLFEVLSSPSQIADLKMEK